MQDEEFVQWKAAFGIHREDEDLLARLPARLAPHRAALFRRTREPGADAPPDPRVADLCPPFLAALIGGVYDLRYARERISFGEELQRKGAEAPAISAASLRCNLLVIEALRTELALDPATLACLQAAFARLVALDLALLQKGYVASLVAEDADSRAWHSQRFEAVGGNGDLESARREITDLVVHDLKSPLTAVSGVLQLLERTTQADPFTAKALRGATRRCRDLWTMIENLLQVRKMEGGPWPVRTARCDLAEVVREGVREWSAFAAEEGKDLAAADPLPQAIVLADEALLGEVVSALLHDAVRRAPGDSRIEVTLVPAPGAWRLAVTSAAVPIHADLQRELFVRLDSPALRKIGIKLDSHLSLTFGKLAARAMGGDLTLDGKAARGTSVALVLPSHR